ncbi:MAG TPA: AAA family ATPase [Polyangium sp.]|nr:AAA family ATPase [Polyangium sp.]
MTEERLVARLQDPRHGWLRQLEIRHFRNICGATLTFDDQRNVIIGPSGSGKTTLLQLIAMAVASNFAGLEREEFSLVYELVSFGGVVRVVIQNRGPSDGWGLISPDGAELAIPVKTHTLLWTYEITLTSSDGTEDWVRANPSEARCGRAGSAEEADIEIVDPFRPYFLGRVFRCIDRFDRRFNEAPTVPMFLHEATSGRSGIRGSSRFDEVLGTFDAMTGRGAPARTVDAIAPPAWTVYPRDPSAFPDANASVPDCVLAASRVDATCSRHGPEHIPFLARALEVLELPNGEMHLGFVARLVGGSGGVHYDRLGFTLTLPDGVSISHERLSFGQKRVLSFFYHLAVSEDVLLADELSNGLHPAWLAACLASIAPRQAFLTTASPHLFDHLSLSFGSADELARSVVRCRREGSKVVFEPLDASAADLVFRVTKARAEGTTELLQARLF